MRSKLIPIKTGMTFVVILGEWLHTFMIRHNVYGQDSSWCFGWHGSGINGSSGTCGSSGSGGSLVVLLLPQVVKLAQVGATAVPGRYVKLTTVASH
jgi:hypothetical protein